MTDVVLYMRYSSERQTEQSIEGQQRVCREFCERQGYTIVKEYIDRAASAFRDSEKRVFFQQMIKDSEKQQWEAVVVYKLDRFARNRNESAIYKMRLKRNGVKVISATENISDNPEGVILEAVLEGMAEFYSLELAQKVNRGMTEGAYKCHYLGGTVPLGYHIVGNKAQGKRYEIDETTAGAVREAFNRYAYGERVADICRILNESGYRTITGGKFNKNSFRRMLQNERYAGVYIYKDIRIENGIPAIIDKELFKTVQDRLSKNQTTKGGSRAKVEYLLSQKIFCGHCGSLMAGETATSKTKTKYSYYNCGNRRRKRGCNKQIMPKDWIERLVLEDTMQLINDELLEEIAETAVREAECENEKNNISPLLEQELKETEKSINNLLALAEKGADFDTIAPRINTLTEQKKAVLQRLANAKGDKIVLKKEHVLWWLQQFTKGDIKDINFCRHLIDLLVNSVTVWDEDNGIKLTIIYNLTPQKSSTIRVSDKNAMVKHLHLRPNSTIYIGLHLCATFTHNKKRR